jgi:hypothetical protein
MSARFRDLGREYDEALDGPYEPWDNPVRGLQDVAPCWCCREPALWTHMAVWSERLQKVLAVGRWRCGACGCDG